MDVPTRSIFREDSPDRSALWRQVRRGGLDWEIQSGFANWLGINGELPIGAWLDDGTAVVIKTGPHRTVYRLDRPEGRFYLKHYRIPDWQALFLNVVRPCKADLEKIAAKETRNIGLPTFQTIAVGKKKRLGVTFDSFFLSREIPAAEPLDQFVLETFPSLSSDEQTQTRRQIAKQLGEITSRLHRHGLIHRDLHPGNLLIQRQGGNTKLFLIDLHAMGQRRRLSLNAVGKNIALLSNFFYRFSTRADRRRFLKAYLETTKEARPRKEWAGIIEQICLEELAQADARGDKKWQRGNRRLVIRESGPNKSRGLAELGTHLLDEFCENPHCLIEPPIFQGWRKTSASRREAFVDLLIDDQPVRCLLIELPKPGLARNAWEMGHAIIRRRLPALKPLGFIEPEQGQVDYLLIEHRPDAKELRNLLGPANKDDLNDASERAGRMLRQLHHHGFHQRELTIDSFLAEWNGRRIQLAWSGLETLDRVDVFAAELADSLGKLWRSLPDHRSVSLSQRLRFLRGYLGDGFSKDWKTHWQLADRSTRIARREAA